MFLCTAKKSIYGLALLTLSCTTSSSSACHSEEESVFKFDPASQKCLNQWNQEGLNPLNPEQVFAGFSAQSSKVTIRDRDAQCIDFAGIKFHEYIGAGYSILHNWDFRGSDFSRATIYFNFITEGKFSGSQLTDLTVGYGRVSAQDIDFDVGDMPSPNVIQ